MLLEKAGFLPFFNRMNCEKYNILQKYSLKKKALNAPAYRVGRYISLF